jgi:hypothetical protein
MIDEFRFNSGSSYCSQEYHGLYALGPGTRIIQEGLNCFTVADQPLIISKSRPLLLGFVADVTCYKNSYYIADANAASWKAGVPEEIRKKYLRETRIYDISCPYIRKISESLMKDSSGPLQTVERVWMYVYSHMSYVQPRRAGWSASAILRGSKGVCGDYTVVTMALLRACGIPARMIISLRVPTGRPSRLDHVWTEAYIPGIGWLPVQSQVKPRGHFKLDAGDNLIVWRSGGRGNSIRHKRIIEQQAGFFAEMAEQDRQKAVRLLQAICVDRGANGLKHLAATRESPSAMRPMLYWTLVAIEDEKIALQAAKELVELLKDESNGDGKLLQSFIDLSPKLVANRLRRFTDHGQRNRSESNESTG